SLSCEQSKAQAVLNVIKSIGNGPSVRAPGHEQPDGTSRSASDNQGTRVAAGGERLVVVVNDELVHKLVNSISKLDLEGCIDAINVPNAVPSRPSELLHLHSCARGPKASALQSSDWPEKTTGDVPVVNNLCQSGVYDVLRTFSGVEKRSPGESRNDILS